LLTSSVTPFMPSRKPLSPSPRPLPSSGSFLPPKSTRTTMAIIIRCVGCSRSPIMFSLTAGWRTPPALSIVAQTIYREIQVEEQGRYRPDVISWSSERNAGEDAESNVAIEDGRTTDNGFEDGDAPMWDACIGRSGDGRSADGRSGADAG